MYRVVIVEDDYMVSMVNRSFLEKDGRFQVLKEFASGEMALGWILNHPVDLVLLDMYMPSMTGLELLRQLRNLGSCVDVIVVTAAHEVDTLRELLGFGVVDYLVKPFGAERFSQALERFCCKYETLKKGSRVRQEDIDQLINPQLSKGKVPKGLQEKTLEKINGQLHESQERTCEEISADAGLSVVTVRRYLNFMVDSQWIDSRIRYDTGGRPCAVYWRGKEVANQGNLRLCRTEKQ